MATAKSLIKTLLRHTGYEVRKYDPVPDPNIKRRMRLISTYGINTIFDVGANIGQYASLMRASGYNGKILSFEPLSSAYSQLKVLAAGDPNWETVNIGLGDTDGEHDINIANNSFSSSILDMLPSHITAAPESAYVGKEKIIVKKIDSVIDEYRRNDSRIFLKIDTQGYEKNVIDGAAKSLRDIIGIQLEMSLTPLYKGELLWIDMIGYLAERGYVLMSLEPGFGDTTTGRMLQIDGIFFRESG